MCTSGDFKNMIKCDWCNGWMHSNCIGINLEQLKTLIEIQPKNNTGGFPFQCKICRTLMSSQWEKLFKDLSDDVHNKGKVLENGISQTNKNISQIDCSQFNKLLFLKIMLIPLF